MDYRQKNVPTTKRVFGKDITNYERRPKASSICEKSSLFVDVRTKSKSMQKKNLSQSHDAILQYEQEISNFMFQLQHKQKKQLIGSITPDMRLILIDWLIQVHNSFQLKEQTLYLALAYLNQYSSMCEITKHDYQLVGIACLWIASKFQQIYPPRMNNYVQVTDSSYTISQLKNMESKILLALNFNLNFVTPLQILQMISDKWPKESNGKLKMEYLRVQCYCKYIIQLAIFDGHAKEYCMKSLVLGAIMLAQSILKIKIDIKSIQNQKIQRETIMKCFKELCISVQNGSKVNTKLKAIRKKYSEQRYLSVSRCRIQAK